MALTFKRICRGAITNTSQPHGEELIPVDTNEPTSYVGRWDVSRTASDSVRAYLTGTSNNYELHFYGYGATTNFARTNNNPFHYNAPWESYSLKVKKVVAHDGVTDLGQFTLAMLSNTNPTIAVELADTVRVLQRYCFWTTKITSFTLGAGLRSIYEGSLPPASANTSIAFPSCMRIAHYSALSMYSSNTGWYDEHTTAGGYLVVADGVLLWGKPTGTAWTIPEGVKSIACYGWYNAANVTAVTLPSTTKYIATAAFAAFSNLQKIKLPQGTERIHAIAFQNCSNLAKIWIPRSVKIIDTSSIQTTTGAVANAVFVFFGCSNLTIYCEIGSSEVPEGWSEYWNYIASGTQATVVWNTSEAAFDAL